MNRRFLVKSSIATSVTFILPQTAFAQTPESDNDDDLDRHTLQKWTREFESSGFTMGSSRLEVAAREIDTEKWAKELYAQALDGVIASTNDAGFSLDERTYSKLTDEGHLLQGEYTSEGTTAQIAIILARQNKMVYSMPSVGLGEQASIVTGLYDLLFARDRDIDDVLPTLDEVPPYLVLADENYVDYRE